MCVWGAAGVDYLCGVPQVWPVCVGCALYNSSVSRRGLCNSLWPLHLPLALSMQALLVLDPAGTVFSRTWLHYNIRFRAQQLPPSAP